MFGTVQMEIHSLIESHYMEILQTITTNPLFLVTRSRDPVSFHVLSTSGRSRRMAFKRRFKRWVSWEDGGEERRRN